jgi:hypothetical protein
LPYNTIEILILGNITNTGSTPINLKDSWMIIPFSMGVQTEFEGIWKQEKDPDDYFKIYCWWAAHAPCISSSCHGSAQGRLQ